MSTTNDPDPVTGARSGRGAPLPWWFWTLFALAGLGFVVAPLVSAVVSQTVGRGLVLAPSFLVWGLSQPVARRLRGIGLWSGAPGDASARRAVRAVFVVAVVGSLLVSFLAGRGAFTAAVAVVLLASALIAATLTWQQRVSTPEQV